MLKLGALEVESRWEFILPKGGSKERTSVTIVFKYDGGLPRSLGREYHDNGLWTQN